MRVVKEIGLRKSIRFLLYVPVSFVFKVMFISQLRVFFLKLLGSKINTDSIIMAANFFNWHHQGPGGIQIGEDCFIGDETLIDLYDKVLFENRVTIAQRVLILTHTNVGYSNHPLQKHFPKFSRPVHIKDGSVVGAGSILLPGVTVGKNSFIAAGSVVTKNVPNNSLYAGSPAKLVRKII